jgi:hypothetical protein
VARSREGWRAVHQRGGGWCIGGEGGGWCARGEEGDAWEGRMEGSCSLRAALHERSVSMRDLTGRKIERERGKG